MRDDFAVMIVTYGRPDKQDTVKMLRNMGYSGKLILICDNTDPTVASLKEKEKCDVMVFNKKEAAKRTDTMYNRVEMKSPVYAMNYALGQARWMGLKYVAICDDDMKGMQFRPVIDGKLKSIKIKKADPVFEAILRFMDGTGIKAMCPARADGYTGGAGNQFVRDGVKYNLSQMIFLNTNINLTFRGTLYVDFIASMDLMNDNRPAFAYMGMSVLSPGEGSNKGGCADVYEEDTDRYVAKYYAMMAHPGYVSIGWNKRKKQFFHRVGGAVSHPYIISERWRKARSDHEK